MRRILRVAADSIYLSFKGRLGQTAIVLLDDRKTLAKDKNPAQKALAQHVIGERIFAVAPHGRGHYRFILHHPDFSLEVGIGGGYPLASVQVASEFLAQVGPEEALRQVRHVVNSLGTVDERETLSRLDLAVDFIPDASFEMFPVECWVTRASKSDPHFVDGAFTGWSVGLGGDVSGRLYDKITEIFQKSRKAHWFELWANAGFEAGDQVWRLEFQFRRSVLQELGAGTVADAIARLAGIWSYGLGWLSLRTPTEDQNRSRWPVAPLWGDLERVDWGMPAVRLKRMRRLKLGAFSRQSKQVLGLIASYMGERGITDHEEGIDAFLADSEDLARSEGTTIRRYLDERARAKARLACTINNRRELGLDRLDVDAAADAYRKAKDGEA